MKFLAASGRGIKADLIYIIKNTVFLTLWPEEEGSAPPPSSSRLILDLRCILPFGKIDEST
jgi:hypothetical protein